VGERPTVAYRRPPVAYRRPTVAYRRPTVAYRRPPVYRREDRLQELPVRSLPATQDTAETVNNITKNRIAKQPSKISYQN
jgi:hypothetical protein